MLSKPARAVAFQLLSLGVAFAAVLIIGRIYPLGQLLHRLDGFIAAHQPWSTLLYPFIHATCNLLLLPGGMLVIGSGFLFGLWQGFLVALTGHLLAAAGAFWISRTFGRRFVERHLANRPQWRELDLAIEREGWKIVALSQASPLFPTSLFNYCYGLTRLRFWPCLGWIALGWSPGMFLYAYLGRLGHFGWQAWKSGGHASRGQTAFWIGGLFVSLLVTVLLTRLALRLLREARARTGQETSEPEQNSGEGRSVDSLDPGATVTKGDASFRLPSPSGPSI